MKIFQNVEDFDALELKDKASIRDGLYEDTKIIDRFIDENPEDFPLKELAIVSNWKNFIKGDFFIERHLKKYSIFIGEENEVYAVSGLMNSIEEIIPKYALPLRVKTVLLPFQDQIVYDGFLAHYNIYFGSGIKNNLKHAYMKAKRRDEIIFSLNPNTPTKTKKKIAKPAKNWKPLIKELTKKARKLRGGAGQIELLSPTFSLLKASLELLYLHATRFCKSLKARANLHRRFSNKRQKHLHFLSVLKWKQSFL